MVTDWKWSFNCLPPLHCLSFNSLMFISGAAVTWVSTIKQPLGHKMTEMTIFECHFEKTPNILMFFSLTKTPSSCFFRRSVSFFNIHRPLPRATVRMYVNHSGNVVNQVEQSSAYIIRPESNFKYWKTEACTLMCHENRLFYVLGSMHKH